MHRASTPLRMPWKQPSPKNATSCRGFTRAKLSGLTTANLDHVFQQPDNLEARAAMQLGAAYAGTAIENSMLGAAHSAANPLTARFGIIHGQAVGIMLPHVVRFNAQQPESAAIYAELARFAGLAAWSDRAEQAVEALIARDRVPAPGQPNAAFTVGAEHSARPSCPSSPRKPPDNGPRSSILGRSPPPISKRSTPPRCEPSTVS